MSGRPRLDPIAFASSVMIVAGLCVPLILNPEAGATILPKLYDIVATTLGPIYLLAGSATLVFLLWLASSRFGAVRLGGPDAQPEFSTLSWAGMLFCAGVGAGLMYWAAIEWSYYLQTPPWGLEPRSSEAQEWAAAYGLFHWGPTAWAFYCLPTLAIGYAYHNGARGALRLSAACEAAPGFGPDRAGGRIIDVVFMISLLGGAGSSLGFSTPMIAELLGRLFGLKADYGLQAGVLAATIVLFAISAGLGVKRGIRRLSDLNVVLMFAFLAFVLIAGPTLWLIGVAVDAYGLVLQNFIRLNTWTEPFGTSGFVKDWTVFYWAWWIAYGPVVGLFVARISRGRSLRGIIAGMLVYGSLGGGLFFLILGNYGLYLETTGAVALTARVDEGGGAKAILAMLETLPFAPAAIAVFALTAIIFSATTYDSASYSLASASTKRLESGAEPALWLRLFWAAALGALPLTLLFVGGQRVVQTATLLASAPLLLVGLLSAISLMRRLRRDVVAD